MGSLKELQDSSRNVHLLFTNSNKAELYVYDILKKSCGANKESIYDVDSKKAFNEMLELSSLQPYLADRWLFVVNFSKLKGMCKQNKSVFQSDVSTFLVKVSNYRDYKEFKTILGNINDMYLAYIKRADLTFVLKEYKLSQKLFDFVASSYSSDLDKIFELKEQLNMGMKIESAKDIVSLIGASGGSVSKFALQLLGDPPKNEKGLNMVLRNRVKDARMLSETYGVRSFRNFLCSSVKDILDIKVLYNQGVIFKHIREIPENFDEKRLSRYEFCLERIETEIPYSRILKLYCMLKDSFWYTDKEMLEFIYKYYGGV